MRKFLVCTLLLFFCAGPVSGQDAASSAEEAVMRGEKLQYEPAAKSAAAAGEELKDVIVMEPQEDMNAARAEEAPFDAGPDVIPIKPAEKSSKKDIKLMDIKTQEKANGKIFTLKECVDIAVKNHLQLEIAKKNVTLGEMRLWEARRNMLPSISMKTEETYGRVYGRRYRGQKSSIEGQQTLFKGGELYFIMKQADTNLKIIREEYGRIKNDLVLQVKKQFYAVAKSKENLAFQVELKKEVDVISAMVKRGFDAGTISRIESLNIASQASQADFQLVSAKGDLSVAELILKQTMNVDPSDNFDIKAELKFREADVDYHKMLELAFANRPEVKIAYMMMDYYNYELRVAKAKGWPKVDVMGSWGLAKENFIEEDNGPNGVTSDGAPIKDPEDKLEQQWYGGLKVSMPFWGSTGEYSFTQEQWAPMVSAYQGTQARTNSAKFSVLDDLKYFSEKKSAEIDKDRSRQEYIKSKQDVTLEVREGCFNYEKSVIQLKTAESKIKYQERELELTRFRRGLDETPDSVVVEALIKFYQEKFSHIQAVTDCITALAAIEKAVGVEDYFETAKGAGKDRGK